MEITKLCRTAINDSYAVACQIGEIDKSRLGIPASDWKKQARALVAAGLADRREIPTS